VGSCQHQDGVGPLSQNIGQRLMNSEHTFEINRERAIDYLNTRENVYVFDGFAGWDPKYRIKVRVIASRAYHALFMVSSLTFHSP
jgi:phosphoenolpyruvate carboxykinase (ATP)